MADVSNRNSTGGQLIGSDYDVERTRKIRAEADIIELELAKRRKEVADTADVVKAWSSVLHAVKTKILASPTKLAPVLATMSDPTAIKDVLEAAMREALDELANYQPHIDPTAVAVASVEPVAEPEKPKRKPGRPKKIDSL